MRWLLAALLTSTGFLSAQAYTCDDVRALSSEQKAYYIRVLRITPAQQERIRRSCFEPTMREAATSDGTITHFRHRERDARAE